jgi:AcrR family transcriptional regulator
MPRGRPASAEVDRALILAAVEEFVLRGYHAMTMESIAARAGVSKVSLYRRWPSKRAVMADVFRNLGQSKPPEDRGSLEADVHALLSQSICSPTAKSAARVLMRTMGEIAGDSKLLALYRKHLLNPRMEQLQVLIDRARSRHELQPDTPTGVVCAMIAGPLFLYQLTLLAGAKAGPPGQLAAQLTRSILSGIATATPPRPIVP